jgi:hypothetical protein
MLDSNDVITIDDGWIYSVYAASQSSRIHETTPSEWRPRPNAPSLGP